MTALMPVGTTLRDGTHAVALDLDALRRTVAALDAAGVPVVEVGHGYGLGGDSLPGASPLDDDEQLAAVAGARRRSRVAVLAVPADAPRAATALVHAAKTAVATVVGFSMLAHAVTPNRLAGRAAELAAAGADVVQIADSAGALLPAHVVERITAVADQTGVPVGVHAHADVGLAVANTLTARDAGVTRLDGTLSGVGAGAGKAAIELVAAALEHGGTVTGVDTAALLAAADETAASWPGPLPRPDGGSVLSSRHGIYGTLLRPARALAARHGVPLPALLGAARGARAVTDLERAAQQLAGGAP